MVSYTSNDGTIGLPTVSSISDALVLPSIRTGFPSKNLDSLLSSVASEGFKASAAAKGFKRIRTADYSYYCSGDIP